MSSLIKTELLAVRDLLNEYWDPIGVIGEPSASGPGRPRARQTTDWMLWKFSCDFSEMASPVFISSLG
jgi:hypothetical protein